MTINYSAQSKNPLGKLWVTFFFFFFFSIWSDRLPVSRTVLFLPTASWPADLTAAWLPACRGRPRCGVNAVIHRQPICSPGTCKQFDVHAKLLISRRWLSARWVTAAHSCLWGRGCLWGVGVGGVRGRQRKQQLTFWHSWKRRVAALHVKAPITRVAEEHLILKERKKKVGEGGG